MWNDDKEKDVFSALSIPCTKIGDDVFSGYRIYRQNGEKIDVEADSAAEAVEKSGVDDAVKIISMATQRDKMMDKNILSSLDESANTDIEIPSDAVSSLGQLLLRPEEIPQSDKREFESFGLGALAGVFSGDEGDVTSDVSEEEAEEAVTPD